MKQPRFPLIDHIRGFAIVLMIFFHFFYNLNLFKYVTIDFQRDLFWFILPRIIVMLFLFCVGISLPLGHLPSIKWPKFCKRFAFVTIGAVGISVITYILFPTRWIYFGTLHCIALCSLLALPFIKYPKISLITGATLLIPGFFKITIPWFTMSHRSMDYIAPFPWLGWVLIGIFTFHVNFHRINTEKLIGGRYLSFLGRHSLIIYLTHQPLLYGLVFIFYWIFK